MYSDQDPIKIDDAIQKKRVGQGRRIILSTNVAETSLTIEDVKYVIDCGFQRRNLFLPKNDGTTVLETVVISRVTKTCFLDLFFFFFGFWKKKFFLTKNDGNNNFVFILRGNENYF